MGLNPLCSYGEQLSVISFLGIAVFLQDRSDYVGEGGGDPTNIVTSKLYECRYREINSIKAVFPPLKTPSLSVSPVSSGVAVILDEDDVVAVVPGDGVLLSTVLYRTEQYSAVHYAVQYSIVPGDGVPLLLLHAYDDPLRLLAQHRHQHPVPQLAHVPFFLF